MALWLQHLLVLAIVGGCFAIVARQGIRSLLGKRSKLGSCCAKGCDAAMHPSPANPQAAGQRVVFFPSEMLVASRRRDHGDRPS